MSRTMYDDVSAANIPADAAMAAGYLDGWWPDFQAIRARLPHIIVVSIATTPADDADVLDVEFRDATPRDCPDWLRRNPGRTLYSSRSTKPLIDQALAANGMRWDPLTQWWKATLDGTDDLSDCVACQHTNTANYDISSVRDFWPGVDRIGDTMSIWGSDTSDINMRIVDGRMAHIREWWAKYRGGEPTIAQQQTAYNLWAQRGGDLVLAGIIDGTIT